MDLHGQIMNIQCQKLPAFPFAGGAAGPEQLKAYKEGHRDARHAAAELALQAEATRDELLSLLRKARDEFKGLPHSLGYEFTHLREIEAALAKHELVSG